MKTTFQEYYDEAYKHGRIIYLEVTYCMKLYEEATTPYDFFSRVVEDQVLSKSCRDAFNKAGSYFGVWL